MNAYEATLPVSPLMSVAAAALSFAVAVLVLSGLSALVTQALLVTFVRQPLQRRLVRLWMTKRMKRLQEARPAGKELEHELLVLTHLVRRGSLFSLRYEQLCGQIATALQAAIPRYGSPLLLKLFGARGVDDALHQVADARAGEGGDDGGEARRRIAFLVDRGVDELQAHLAKRWRWIDYLTALAVSEGMVLALAYTTGIVPRSIEIWLYTSIAVMAALLSSLVRNWLERRASF